MHVTSALCALQVALVAAVSPGSPGSPTTTAAELTIDKVAIDAVFAPYDRDDGPGCALGIIHEGKLVYARGYGMANLEHGIPLSSDTVLRIGSTSKQFTAACAVLAEQQGLIALDDDIRERLPELPEYGKTITIRQLLNHTSGVRDYLQLMLLSGQSDDDYYSNEDVYAMIARQHRLNFEPGTQHLYSNSGYFLISVIIERASGKTLPEFAEEYIFAPLGMTNTHFHDDYTRVVKNRADGHTLGRDGTWKISNTRLEMCGDGGVFTTVEDMLRWDSNFYDPVVGGQAMLAELQRQGVLDDGTLLEYALGLQVSRRGGLRMVSHGGAFVGFRAETVRFPDENVSVEDYVGGYVCTELGVSWTLSLTNGELFSTIDRVLGGALTPLALDALQGPFGALIFERDAFQAISGFRLNSGRVRGLRFERSSH